ncbi:60S acidic ribosomal protein P2A-like [Panicum virgatum]|nr:60S acidic ribosomal protein P2A-like [Panicum virgatum]
MSCINPQPRSRRRAETLASAPRRRQSSPSSSGSLSLPRRSRMKFVAAYLLAVLAGNPSPSAEDLSAILESVGCEIDNEKMELLLSQLSGKDITELIAAGREKFASVPCGGGGVAVAAAAPAAGGAAPAAEAKKEEKVEEKEESDDDMGFSLFD